MVKLIIKIGGNMMKDMKEVWENPRKAEPGTHTLYLKNLKQLQKVLSPKKLELLMELIESQHNKKTLSETAKHLKRKQEAISRDANVLEKYEMVKKTKEKQKVYLTPAVQSIEIRLTN